ncbi:hypothetical protein NPIL_412811 [Nephila pilipes]|uniref:Uncharacterized protein n=1 Tax=Nephila pilipes TaxID=299642 RepID=A0A8X6N5U7_NEPPI|nr:hypothetical protein NPIL_412811 [Nephila pilipes]
MIQLHTSHSTPMAPHGVWIQEIVSISIHFHPPNIIEIVSSSNVFSITNTRRWLPDNPGKAYNFITCSQQRYTSYSSAPKAHYNDGPLNSSHLLMTQHTDTC